MRQVRVEPITPKTSYISIECNCRSSILKNKDTKDSGFKHTVTLGENDLHLECEQCDAVYIVHPQDNHFHVFQTN